MRKRLVPIISRLCGESGCRLLYASLFGSTLYGTAIKGKSDTDVKGVFLPSRKDVLLGRTRKSLNFRTGDDNSRNSSGDIDIDLWSLDYWLLTLLRSGDTGGIDLLFSPSNPECGIFRDPLLDRVFADPLLFIDPKNQQGYISYAINQARKYGVKGSRMGVIKRICGWLDAARWTQDARLSDFLDLIGENFAHDEFCQIIECNGERSLSLCGKIHMGSVSLDEFARRVRLHYQNYGERARAAMEGKGIDWKALSHAMRAIWQIGELCESGRISYPLKCAPELLKIKTGQYSWEKVEAMITEGIERTKALLENASFPEYNIGNAESVVLEAYGEKIIC